jgi:hypothetical protein
MTTISQVISISTNFVTGQNKIPISCTNDFYTLQRSILVVLWHPSEWQTPLHKDDVDNAEPEISDHNTDMSLNLLCQSWHSTAMILKLCGSSKTGQQFTLWESWKMFCVRCLNHMYSHDKWKFSGQHDLICSLITTSSVGASQAKLTCSPKDYHKLE